MRTLSTTKYLALSLIFSSSFAFADNLYNLKVYNDTSDGNVTFSGTVISGSLDNQTGITDFGPYTIDANSSKSLSGTGDGSFNPTGNVDFNIKNSEGTICSGQILYAPPNSSEIFFNPQSSGDYHCESKVINRTDAFFQLTVLPNSANA